MRKTFWGSLSTRFLLATAVALVFLLSVVTRQAAHGVPAAGAVVLVAAGMALLFQRWVVAPLGRVAKGAKLLAEGDASHPLAVEGGGEIACLADHINAVGERLRAGAAKAGGVADALAQAVGDLDRSAEELVVVSLEQSSGAAQQASAVQEATTSAERIAATSNEISANVESVEQVAQQTYHACVQGGDDVLEAVRGMEEVKGKVMAIAEAMVDLGKMSQRVGGIAEIIDEISEQTHLLAVNAAIEAAGAGEHGKRFGVVAAEVRRLAERTAEATGQIKEIINEMRDSTNDAVLATERGTAMALAGAAGVDKIGESLATVLALVQQTKESTKEITVATQQQAAAGEQLVITIVEIKDVAIQVSRSAEKVERSVLRLKELARTLKDLVEQDRHAGHFAA